MIIIVCGSAPRVGPPERPGWTDRPLLWRTLDDLDAEDGPLVIVEGEAPGADTMARQWARSRDRELRPFPANWSRGRAAGPIRNRRMLGEEPELVMAFSVAWPPIGGTLDMCEQARAADVPVVVVTPDAARREFAPVESS